MPLPFVRTVTPMTSRKAVPGCPPHLPGMNQTGAKPPGRRRKPAGQKTEPPRARRSAVEAFPAHNICHAQALIAAANPSCRQPPKPQHEIGGKRAGTSNPVRRSFACCYVKTGIGGVIAGKGDQQRSSECQQYAPQQAPHCRGEKAIGALPQSCQCFRDLRSPGSRLVNANASLCAHICHTPCRNSATHSRAAVTVAASCTSANRT